MTDSVENDDDIVSIRDIVAALPDHPSDRWVMDHHKRFGGVQVGKKYYFPPNWKEVLFNGAKPTFPQHPSAPKRKVGLEKDSLDSGRKSETVQQRDHVRIVRTGISRHGSNSGAPGKKRP